MPSKVFRGNTGGAPKLGDAISSLEFIRRDVNGSSTNFDTTSSTFVDITDMPAQNIVLEAGTYLVIAELELDITTTTYDATLQLVTDAESVDFGLVHRVHIDWQRPSFVRTMTLASPCATIKPQIRVSAGTGNLRVAADGIFRFAFIRLS